MLRKIAIFLGGLLMLAAGFFGYQKYLAEPELRTIGQLIADDALWVYHSQHFSEDWKRISASPVGRLIASVPDVQSIGQGAAALDSAALFSLLNNHSVYIVCQVVGNDDLGFSFYLDIDDTELTTDWSNLIQNVKNSPDWKVESQQYLGMKIQEWVNEAKQLRFSWIRADNFLIGSFTPFLVEDQIRRLNNNQVIRTEVVGNSWRSALNQRSFSLRDQGDVIINGKQLSRLVSIFVTDEGSQSHFLKNSLADRLMLDLSIEKGQWLFSGFSEAPLGPAPYFLSTFREQSTVRFGVSSYLPGRTAVVRQYTFSESESWAKEYLSFLSQTEDSVRFTSWQRRFQDNVGSSFPDWFSWAGNELAVVTLETSDDDQLILVEIADTAALPVAMSSLLGAGDTVRYQEAYAGYTLHNLYDSPLPNLLTGNGAPSSGEYFWYQDADFLVLSNRLNALKLLISNRATENTWNKSPRQLRFLEQSVNPANLSLLVDVPRYQKQWVRNLSPKWAKWAKSQEDQLNKLNKIAWQFSTMGDEYYTSMVVTYQTESPALANDFVTVSRLRLDTLIGSKPFVVRGAGQQLRVVVQDQANVVSLLDPSQPAVQWSDSTGASVVGEITRINLPNSSPPNYVWATDSAIHLVDRSGNYVDGYPFYLPQGIRVNSLSVFDYEQNGDYRFLVTDPAGQLWLFNADRDNLSGWNPLSLTAPLDVAPQHIRVRGKDCIVALLQNGLLYLLNRRGETYPGFPVDLGQACENPLFIKTGNSFADSELTTITERGEIISVNFEGSLLKREQLLRTSSENHFLLCPDRLGKDFILARQDDQRLSILDETGKVWFEQSYFTPGGLSRGELSIQYYNFGTDNQIIAISDKVQEFTYLFNQEGQLLNNRPIESSGEVALLYSESEGKYQLYRIYEDELAVITF